MQIIGLFRELEPEAVHLSPLSMVTDKLDSTQRATIAMYLRAGIPFFDVMGGSVDPLNPSTVISGGPSLVSDGEFIWRHDLAYFIESYGVDVPSRFIRKAFARTTIPSEGEILAQWSALLSAYETYIAKALDSSV